MSTAKNHNKGDEDILKLIDPNGVAIRILNSHFGQGTIGTVEKNKRQRTLVFKNANEETLDIFYVYASGVYEEQQERGNVPTNVTVLSRRYLETNWDIKF